jgi:hypothetical protein
MPFIVPADELAGGVQRRRHLHWRLQRGAHHAPTSGRVALQRALEETRELLEDMPVLGEAVCAVGDQTT